MFNTSGTNSCSWAADALNKTVNQMQSIMNTLGNDYDLMYNILKDILTTCPQNWPNILQMPSSAMSMINPNSPQYITSSCTDLVGSSNDLVTLDADKAKQMVTCVAPGYVTASGPLDVMAAMIECALCDNVPTNNATFSLLGIILSVVSLKNCSNSDYSDDFDAIQCTQTLNMMSVCPAAVGAACLE